MNQWQSERPSNLEGLFSFYQEFVKPLYGTVQSYNELPVEVLFELNAALDHISRHWTYQEDEQGAVDKAYGHLKRCCLDVFKIKTKEALDQYENLTKIDISCIDNGDFERSLHILASEIREGAKRARHLEGQPDGEDSVPAFDVWCPVFEKCVQLEKDFFLHPRINWAKRRGFWQFIESNTLAFIIGYFGSAIVTYTTTPKGTDLTRMYYVTAAVIIAGMLVFGKQRFFPRDFLNFKRTINRRKNKRII